MPHGIRMMDERDRRMADIRANFSQRTREYDEWIRKVIPHYDEMLDRLVEAAVVDGGGARVIDLGCGTGTLSEKFLGAHQGVDMTCLDMTEAMLDLARSRLRDRQNVRYVVADLYDFHFNGPYDMIISSLALHHLVTDEDKRALYRRVFEALAPQGMFLNADIVLASHPRVQDLNMERWKRYMRSQLPQDEIDNVILPRHYQEDSPARLVDHLRWLEQAGFDRVDVVWKNMGYAVYGGSKDL
jgi:tRNA (cmo5U34)-methyltransferase